MTRPGDAELRRELSRLERVAARDGFTDAVLGRIARRSGDRRRRGALKAALAAAVLGALLVSGRLLWSSAEESRAAERAARLRAEHAALREELDRLRAIADEDAPLLYLGGDDEMDLVLDLRPLVERRPGGGGAALANDRRP